MDTMVAERNLGDELVRRVEERLGCRRPDVAPWRGGFTWRPAGLTQHVWSESLPRAAADEWRVHVRTWCLKGLTGSRDQMAALSQVLPQNALCALVRNSGRPSQLELATAIHVRHDNVNWVSRLVVAAARLQAHDALRLCQTQALTETGIGPDLDGDTMRSDVPRLPDALDDGLFPEAATDDLPFDSVARRLRAEPGVRAIATKGGVTASFPWPVEADHRAIVFEMRIDAMAPIGLGLAVSMALPVHASLERALALNDAETRAGSDTDVLGGWMVREGMLVHASFLPRYFCASDVVGHLPTAAVRRAAWIRSSGLLPEAAPPSSGDRGRIIRFPS